MATAETFVYRLTIINRSLRDLLCTGGELRRGRWFRDGEKDAKPVAIPSGGTREAMAIMGAPGKGCACLCGWRLDGEPAGSLALRIDVPFLPGKNKAGLDISGALRVEGWDGIPTVGNVFSHTLTVR